MKKPLKEKIAYRRKMANGETRVYIRNNPYKKSVRLQGSMEVSRKNFIRSLKRHLYKNDAINFISVEKINEDLFWLHYSSKTPLISGEGVSHYSHTGEGMLDTQVLLATIDEMTELDAWKSKDFRKIYKRIILENSVSQFNHQYNQGKNCYLFYDKDEKFNRLLASRMGISNKMAERLISSLFNRIRYPFLYTQPKKLNAAYPPILSHKDLFLEMNLLAMAREVSTSMKRFKKRFLNEEDDEDAQINIITEYILAEEYHSFTQSKLAYELGEMDMDEDIYRREHYLPLYREIMRDKENQIEAFKVFLDGTIAYLDETSKVPISIAYLIDAIAEKIVPFLELEFLTDKLDEMIEKKNSYIAKVHLKEEIEWDEIKVHVEGVLNELEEGRELYELYKVLREGNAISLFLKNAHSTEHKNIIRQYLAYDKDLALEIKTPEPLIDLWIAVENDREHYHRLSDEARKIAEILGLTVEVPFL